MRRRRRRSEREAARLYPVRRNKKRHKNILPILCFLYSKAMYTGTYSYCTVVLV